MVSIHSKVQWTKKPSSASYVGGFVVYDAKLRQAVLDELRWDPSVTATCVGVDVQAGRVTLTGHVASLAEKLET